MAVQPTHFHFLETDTPVENQDTLIFRYQIVFANNDPLEFTETIRFPGANWQELPAELQQSLYQLLHIVLGVSYYKLYIPPQFSLPYQLTEQAADFFNTLYKYGLGEFLYQNQLSFTDLAKFQATEHAVKTPISLSRQNRSLVGIGGGKDSIVAAEILKEQNRAITGLSIETGKQGGHIVDEVIKVMQIGKQVVERQLAPEIFQTHPNSYNGHIPISAIFAVLGVAAAALYDYNAFVVSNEQSSNFGNLEYQAEQINHQWSKSAEFENLFSDYLRTHVTDSIQYYSLLRPLWEIQIVEKFVNYPEYFSHFSSCNRSFTVEKERSASKWCGECPKCAFMWLLLGAYLDAEVVTQIFGKNLFANEQLTPLFKDLLGLGDLKPFDCVGTFSESKVAFNLAAPKFKDTPVVKELEPLVNTTEQEQSQLSRTGPAPNLPDHLLPAVQRNCLILGYGLEGKTTEAYLKENHPSLPIGIADQKDDPSYLERQQEYDLVIKTPGVSPEKLTRPYTTATNLFLSQIPNKVIGVTGSKGKSTTASLMAHILEKAGRPVILLGNIGEPMLKHLEAVAANPEMLVVLELSSYMLNDIHTPIDYAIATSLFPEHLDYHGGLAAYYQAKANIVKYQRPTDLFIYNPAFTEFNQWTTPAQRQPYLELPTSVAAATPLVGDHNLGNLQAVYTLAIHLGVSEAEIITALSSFKPLPHRLQEVGTYKGITFYDDAISTTPESAIMALNALPKTETIFLGGTDRGYDYKKLNAKLAVSNVKNIVLFPDSGKYLLTEESSYNVLQTDSMEEAVRFAYEHTTPGKICLLSTAAPSYSLWDNFIAKGKEFQQFVEELGL